MQTEDRVTYKHADKRNIQIEDKLIKIKRTRRNVKTEFNQYFIYPLFLLSLLVGNKMSFKRFKGLEWFTCRGIAGVAIYTGTSGLTLEHFIRLVYH